MPRANSAVLVTQASAGFVPAVSEWVIGAMLDLARGTTAYAQAYRQSDAPVPRMGRELRPSTLGVIGYGQISPISARAVNSYEAAQKER